MKVLFDHQIFSYQVHGGISRYYCELLSYLPDYDISPELAVVFSNNSYLRKKNLSFHLPLFPKFNLRLRNQLILGVNNFVSERRLKQQHFDIFHPTYYDLYFLDRNVLGKKPFVLTVHDMTQEKYIPDDPIIKVKHKLIEQADRIIAISEHTKKDILQYVDHIDPDKISVIYHGSDLKASTQQSLGKHMHIPCEKYVLYVGARYGYKNFHHFIKAFALLGEKYKDISLVCTGSPFTKMEGQYFDELKLAGRVFSIVASDTELANLYKHAEFFVFPSLYEGFGIPILEAFSLGCPVVISSASCFPEIAGNAAMYFDPNEVDSIYASMENMLIHPDKRDFFIKQGYERERMFSWSKTAEQTAVLYKSI